MYEDAVKDMGFLLFDLDNPARPFRKGFDHYYELDEADKD
jgi:putative heme iron utilization protein